ncbi:DTW domain-containing protein 1 [Phlyctochytrium planicorne]|nr:DTW domain-containing protein 1 [Phlyctochytrium planicorne]
MSRNSAVPRMISLEPEMTERADLSQFRISDSSALQDASREVCSGCSKSCMVFCPECARPLGHTSPSIVLPIPLDIYRHPRECIGKTTSVHAKLVAPDHVNLYVDDLKDVTAFKERYPDPTRVLLLFPTSDSTPVEDIDPDQYDRIVVLDGTWKQARSMCSFIENIPFKRVRISEQRTLFWRYQKYGDFCLATIEAIYWFYREILNAKAKKLNEPIEYNGLVDDLLFYFKLQYDKIQNIYKSNPDKTFTCRKLDSDSYIKY